jgi:hypothetical protein
MHFELFGGDQPKLFLTTSVQSLPRFKSPGARAPA